MSTIEETITRLRELDNVASPAPWCWYDHYFETWPECEQEETTHVSLRANGVEEPLLPPMLESALNSDHIMMMDARNALPVLLTEIDRLTTRLSIAEARLGRVAANHPEAYLPALEGDKE